MTRALTLALFVLSIPSAASALQLQWASGQHNIAFTEATTCTLVVSSDANEITLPQQWHLLWVARNCPTLTAKLDTTLSDSSTAHVWATLKSTPAEEHAHLRALELRSACRSFATSARYILDLPAGSAGTLQAVGTLYSVDLPEEALLLRSPLATFNGGAGTALPTAIITARSEHLTTDLSISAKGTDMRGIISAELVAPDTAWSIPLTIVSQSDTTLHAHADVPKNVPAAVLQVRRAGGSTSASSLAAAACDQPITNAVPQGNGMFFTDPDPSTATKDFAFFHNTVSSGGNRLRDLFHLYYIRQLSNGLEPCLAHAWSQDLTHWKVDIATSSSALFPSKDLGDPTIPVTVWDRVNVWAPSIVSYRDSIYMFYAGVDINNDQRIGYATTTLLDTCNTRWTRRPLCVLSADSSVWATRRRPTGLGQQFRDPYVFAHPNTDSASAGKFFMVYTAMSNPSGDVFNTAVGLARNLTPGSMTRWVDLGFYRSTVPSVTGFSGLEGPIMFQDMGSPRGWLCMMSNSSNSATGTTSARFERQTPGFGPQDLDLTTPANTQIWPTTAPPRPLCLCEQRPDRVRLEWDRVPPYQRSGTIFGGLHGMGARGPGHRNRPHKLEHCDNWP